MEIVIAYFEQRRKTAALLLLVLALFASPLARGGVDWRVQLAIAIATGGSLLLCAAAHGPRLPYLVLGLMAVFGAILLQLVPIPSGLLRQLSPSAADLFQTSLGPLGLFPSIRPLSLDPAATALEVAKSACCLMAAAAAALLAQERRTRLIIAKVLALSGGAVLVLSASHGIATFGSVIASTFPFKNPNHLAGFLTLTAWPALGLALGARGYRRALWLSTFVVSACGVWLSASRGGMVSFFFGIAVFGILSLRGARSRPSPRKGWQFSIAATAVALALAIAAFLGADRLWAEFRTVPIWNLSSIDKIALWPLLASMARKFFLTGIGRGAFATTFPAFKVDPDSFTWTHAENEWLQPLVDLGIPCGLLLIGTFVWNWIQAASGRALSAHRIGLLAGTAALAVHNLVDFSLEILGVALPFVVSHALLAATGWSVRTRRLGLVAFSLVGMLTSVTGLAVHQAHSTGLEEARLAMRQTPAERARVAGETLIWHPADYLPHAAAGISMVQAGDCDHGAPWLARAMILNPTAPDPHYFFAMCLTGQRQHALARREYRLAYLLGRKESLPAAMHRYPALRDLLEMVPDSPDGLVTLGALLAEEKRFADAASVFERAWKDYGDPTALIRLGDIALTLGNNDEALSWSQQLRELQPQAASSYSVASAALFKLGKLEAAQSELALGAAQVPGSATVLIPLAELLIQQRHFAEARRALAQVVPRERSVAVRVHQLTAETLRAEGRLPEAIAQMQAASEIDPADARVKVGLSELFELVAKQQGH